MGKEKIIPVFALIILIIGVISASYVNATQINKDTISISGEDYTIDQIFYLASTKSIETIEGVKTGIKLNELMEKVGTGYTVNSEFTIKAKDGYQQSVEWDIFKTGVLSKEKQVFFPDTPKKFWVKDIVEIEVK